MSTTATKERPVIFTGESVRAILAGRKCMTRRVCKPAMGMGFKEPAASVHPDGAGVGWIAWWPDAVSAEDTAKLYPGGDGFRSPYGRVGDRLWVKETWCYEDFGGCTRPDAILYAADGHGLVVKVDGEGFEVFRKDGTEASAWQSPLFMPRDASRLTVEITDIRVERVAEISEADAQAEGCPKHDGSVCVGETCRAEFRARWDALNAARGFPWSSNCWVWVVSFKPVTEAAQ